MPQDPVELVRNGIAAWSRGDIDGFLSLFAPECEVSFRPDVPEPGPFRGRTELRQWAEGFLSAWETHRADIVQADAAADHVFALVRTDGVSAATRIETESTEAFVFTFREGQVVRWHGFSSADEAREYAGLSQ